jgi:hypothetical protein
LIATYEREATAWFEHQARSLADRMVGAVESAGRTMKTVVDQGTWPIGPHNLPAAGDKRWLEVGEFMRRQGVI